MLTSLLITPFLVFFVFDFVEGNTQDDTRLKALKSLIYNNAEATVKLDSTALKQLIHLSTKGTVFLYALHKF
jgi:hypothetical protein